MRSGRQVELLLRHRPFGPPPLVRVFGLAFLCIGTPQTGHRIALLSMARIFGQADPTKLVIPRGYRNTVSYNFGLQVKPTETLTLRVQNEYERFDLTGAYAASALLAVMAVAVLMTMTLLERRRRAA